MDVDKLKKWLDSPEGEKDFEEYMLKATHKDEHSQKRFFKVGEYLENCDFDVLMERLRDEHDEEYCEKCYKKGYEPYNNRKLSLLLNWICDRFESIEISNLDSMFLSETYMYSGYIFQLFQGQGSFWRISKRIDDNYETFFQV